MSHELSVLVVSCDKYADLWSPFFHFFWRYWPDCPYAVYLGANWLVFNHPKVITLLTGNDKSWAESTRKMLSQIDSPYVLVMLEDFFLREYVDTRKMQHYLEALVALGGGYLRLCPRTLPDRPVQGYPDIGEIERGAPYRAALQAAIWRKDVLLELLRNGESAWDMEVIGSRRSDGLSYGFYSTWRTEIHYLPAVTFGKWVRAGIHVCQAEGVPCDLSRRPVMTVREDFVLKLRRRQSAMIKLIPWKFRRRVVNWLRETGLRV